MQQLGVAGPDARTWVASPLGWAATSSRCRFCSRGRPAGPSLRTGDPLPHTPTPHAQPHRPFLNSSRLHAGTQENHDNIVCIITWSRATDTSKVQIHFEAEGRQEDTAWEAPLDGRATRGHGGGLRVKLHSCVAAAALARTESRCSARMQGFQETGQACIYGTTLVIHRGGRSPPGTEAQPGRKTARG